MILPIGKLIGITYMKGSLALTETKRIQAQGISNAKIILIGEHSVVYGQPAIALPLTTVNVKVTIEKSDLTDINIESTYFNGQLDTLPNSMIGFKHLIDYLTNKNNVFESLNIKIDSSLPAERGMGSSAAVSIALIRAFYNYINKPLTKTRLLNLANIAEKDTHKNPSGLDAATCASQEPIWMVRNQELKNIPVNLNGYLVIADSGIKGKTSEAISIVKERLIQHPDETQKLIENLGQLTYSAKDALSNNKIELLGDIFNDAQENLVKLGVSCSELNNLISVSLSNGALGSKLTGGGKGGCFINLVKSQSDALHLSNILKQNGATKTWIEPLFKEDIN